MTEFDKTEWINDESAREFIENSDSYIQDREGLFTLLKSFYKYYLSNSGVKSIKVMDMVCGDGRVTQELLMMDNKLSATLVDGSEEMLKNAKKRLKSYPELNYVQSTFQELIENNNLNLKFDLIVSSLAIHHLLTDDKRLLFKYIYNHLNLGGFFLNIDVVRANADTLEEWYLILWKEWIKKKETNYNNSTSYSHIPQKYKNNPDNHPDKLSDQLDMLESSGFKNVDCYYKYGIFSIYGGQR